MLRFDGVSEPARWKCEVLRISITLGIALRDDDDVTSAPSSSDSPGLKNCAEFERISRDNVFGLYSSTKALTSLENICGAMAGSVV